MTLSFAAVARESWVRWRRDGDTLLAIVGPFVFLPMLTWLLLIPEPAVPKHATEQQNYAILIAWMAAHLHWLALRIVIELFASAAILSLYLSREHRDIRSLLRRALTILPGFVFAVVASWGLIALGTFAFIVPGLYVFGRVALTGPIITAEPGTGFADAITRSVALTRGHGWRVFGYLAFTFIAKAVIIELIGSIGLALTDAGAANPVTLAMIDGAAALAVSAVTIAKLLFEVALYRRLAAPRHGI